MKTVRVTIDIVLDDDDAHPDYASWIIDSGLVHMASTNHLIKSWQTIEAIACTSTDPNDHQGDTCPIHESTDLSLDVTERALVDAYDRKGVSGVYQWVMENHPEWEWSPCEPCEEDTATWDGVCSVCFTVKEDN